MTTSEPERVASRRTLLRRAAVTGGAAVATTAATGLTAAPASASAGDPLLIGQSNAGGATTITSAAPDGAATLALRNATGATLQLTDGNSFDPWAPSGAISVNATGLGVRSGNGGQRAFSTANATMLVPVPPTRVLDTRSPAGRARLLAGAGAIDSRGRAVADAWLLVHLDGIVRYGDGMFGNITVANTEKGGFATVYGGGAAPTASTINWWTAGQLLSNGVITQLGWHSERYPDVVAVWVQRSASAVILDVTGLLVYHPESAVINNPKRLAGSAEGDVRADALRARAARGDRRVQPRA